MLVTGGSGFIGSHIVDTLSAEGFGVRVIDKVRPPNRKCDWLKGDVMSRERVDKATRNVEAVFHLAGVTDAVAAEKAPELCISVNELGTLNLLRACSRRDVELFVLASTVWVYGSNYGTVTEETTIPPPDNVYTKSKIGQEHLVRQWKESHALPYTILRYDIPYGPRMRENMAIASFVRKAMRKEMITIHGDGRQGRCWIFVTDLAQAHRAVLNQSAVNQTVNLAGDEFVTVLEIVDLLSKTFGPLPISHQMKVPTGFRGVRTNIEKARKLLGWSPTVSFRDGLSMYIDHVKLSQRKTHSSFSCGNGNNHSGIYG